MNADISIRDATSADAETIVEFNRLLALESESKQLDLATLRPGVARLLADPALGRYFVACQGDQVVGQVMVTFEWSDWRNGPIWWFQSVYVRREYRRLGIFRRLHEHVRRLARDGGQAVGLRLYVERNNTRAHKAYEHAGMADAGYFVMEEMFVPTSHAPN